MFTREKDIYYSLIDKKFQATLSFYYDENKKSALYEIYKAAKTSLKQVLRNIKLTFKPKKEAKLVKELAEKPYWYYVNTRNNLHALSYIFKHHADKSVLVTYGSAEFTSEKVDLKKYYQKTPQWRAIAFIFYLFIHPGYSRRRWRTIFSTFHLYSFYREMLLKYKPGILFFSNDHTANSRALIVAANDLKLTTIYTEHATAKHHYPPLNFSLSILDGEYSYQVYEEAGKTQGEYRNIGVPRLQIKPEYLVNASEIKNIGLAFNMRDAIPKIEGIIKHLIEQYPDKQIHVRPHPRENRKISYPEAPNLFLSEAAKENSMAYLTKLDMLIINNSAIGLEAAAVNVFPVQYNLSNGEQTDANGFIKHNIVTEIHNMHELDVLINKGREPGMYYRNKAQFFDASINTDYEYAVQDKVNEVVDEFISRR